MHGQVATERDQVVLKMVVQVGMVLLVVQDVVAIYFRDEALLWCAEVLTHVDDRVEVLVPPCNRRNP
jgi:hypothetical protein